MVALFVDPKKEDIAVTEARQMNIPVIALANTDCDVSIITHPIVANDTNVSSIIFDPLNSLIVQYSVQLLKGLFYYDHLFYQTYTNI